MRLRDEFGRLYDDGDFPALFPARGRSALPPWRPALVTVSQFMEHLSSLPVAEMLRTCIDWKYALSLDLDDPGFPFSALAEFRARLGQGRQEALLDKIQDAGELQNTQPGQGPREAANR